MIDLETSRQIIDTLDKILVSTYATRMEVVKNIGEYKKKNNIPVLDENREEQVINKVIGQLKVNNQEEYTQDVINLYKYIMDYSKNKQSSK